MEIIIFPGNSGEHLKFFTDILSSENTAIETDTCYLGYRLRIKSENDISKKLSLYICQFMIEFYLKEAILSKIYDEYSCLDVEDACSIMTSLSDKIGDTFICKNIENNLSSNHLLNIESFAIFNIKPIMITVYSLVDTLAEKMIFDKERESFISMIRTFSALYYEKHKTAEVEFADDMSCFVSLDNEKTINIDIEFLLQYLTENSPERVLLYSSSKHPEIAGLISEIFDCKIM